MVMAKQILLCLLSKAVILNFIQKIEIEERYVVLGKTKKLYLTNARVKRQQRRDNM